MVTPVKGPRPAVQPAAAKSPAAPAKEALPTSAPATGWKPKGGPNANNLGDLIKLKAKEVAAPQSFEAQDAAAIAKVKDAILRHDEGAILEVLKNAGPRLANKLWEADLPPWIPPEKYLDTLKTQPGESWKVDWNYDFDEPKARSELTDAVPFLKQPLDDMMVFKKNFPAADQHTPGRLVGHSTYGYTAGQAGSGTQTPNTIRMDTDGRTGKPVAIMTYSKPPHYVAGNGFLDGFKPISPNITLAYGSYTHYGKSDLPPDASAATRLLAGDQRHSWRADGLSFFMYRTKDDAAETPILTR